MADYTYEQPHEGDYLKGVLIMLKKDGRTEIYDALRQAECSIDVSSDYSGRRWNALRTTVYFRIPMSKFVDTALSDEEIQILRAVCARMMPPEAGLDVMDVVLTPQIGGLNNNSELEQDRGADSHLGIETAERAAGQGVQERQRESVSDDVHVLPQSEVSSQTIDDIRQRVTEQQQSMLDAIWRHYQAHDEWLGTRVLHHQFGASGKAIVRSALENLGGSIVFVSGHSDDTRYQLTFLGALLASEGQESERLVLRYLDYVRQRVATDPEVKQVTSAEVEAALGLSKEQSQWLRDLIRLANFWGGGAGFGNDAWQAGIPYDVEDLLPMQDPRPYVYERALRDYDRNTPIDETPRIQFLHQRRIAALRTPNDTNESRRQEAHTVFGSTRWESDQTLCFVLMPLATEFDEVWQDAIRPAVAGFPLRCLRADDIYGPSRIIQDVWQHIVSASVVVADLTGKNPNVFYEVGIAHALEKKVVLLTQNIDDVPFDLGQMRIIKYTKTGRGLEKLRQDLTANIRAALPS